MAATRWGIASAGKICCDFVCSIKSSPMESDHEIVAVSARSLQSAESFASKYGISKAYEGYEAMAKDPNVEVVYVGAINPAHYSIVEIMLNHGKHVLCEKPFGMNVKEVEKLIQLAQKKNLFLMEGLWSRFQPSYIQLHKEIYDLGTIGDVIYAHVDFGRKIESPRVRKMDLGGGAVLDLGVYMIQFANYVFNKEEPEQIVSVGHLNSEGTDDTVSAIFKYSKGRTANLMCSSKVDLPCVATVYGTKGKITLEFPFWSAYKLTTPSGTKEFPLPENKTKFPYEFYNSAGLFYEAQHVRECLMKGLTQSPSVDHDEMLQISRFMEKIRKNVGVVYPQD